MLDFSRRGFLVAAPAFVIASRLDFGVPRKLLLPDPPLLLPGAPIGAVTFIDNPAKLFGGKWRKLGYTRHPGMVSDAALWQRIG